MRARKPELCVFKKWCGVQFTQPYACITTSFLLQVYRPFLRSVVSDRRKELHTCKLPSWPAHTGRLLLVHDDEGSVPHMRALLPFSLYENTHAPGEQVHSPLSFFLQCVQATRERERLLLVHVRTLYFNLSQ